MNEITKIIQIKSSKGGAGVDSASGTSTTKQITQTGSNSAKFTQLALSASDAALAIPSAVTTPCHLQVENLDPTNYVELSIGTGGGFSSGRFSRVPPLDRVPIVAIGSVYVKANTANCLVQVTAAEI